MTPNPNGRYDITQIKEDSLWLSRECKIDEISALRLTILEWQSRSVTRLLQADLEEERSGVLDRSSTGLRSSLLHPNRSSARLAGSLSVNGAKELAKARQVRLLGLYLSERQYATKIQQIVVARALIAGSAGARGKGRASGDITIEQIGADILRSWNLEDVRSSSGNHLLVDLIKSLQSKLQNLGTGSGWFKEDGFMEELELLWSRTHVLEMIHSMETILALTSSFSELNRSDVVLAWFQFTNSVDFLASFDLVSSKRRRRYFQDTDSI